MKTAILLCTYNGEPYLQQQLDSFLSQDYKNWHLFVNDDGSIDKTLDILNDFQKQNDGKVTIFHSTQKDSAKNFLDLMSKIPNADQFDYFACADQDDIWQERKLSAALQVLSTKPQTLPALYGGRTQYMTSSGEVYCLSPLFKKQPHFANALTQSIMGGNTLVFNKATLALMKIINVQPVVAHDWFLYQVVSSVNGFVYYDENSYTLYRQHEANLVGGNRGIKASLARLGKVFQGDYKNWNRRNIAALSLITSKMPKHNQELLKRFQKINEGHLKTRLCEVILGQFQRQNLWQNIVFKCALLLNKI